jgi:hypothetical protein
MGSSNQAAVVFTSKSIEEICSDGGTQGWRMHQSHIGTFDYVICARNRRGERVKGQEKHGSAFLIGTVRDIVPATKRDGLDIVPATKLDDPGKPRFLIRMTEAAIIRDKPDFWQWGRWPTHYDNLDALGIDPADYDFKSLSDLCAEVRKTSGVFVPHEVTSPSPSASGHRSWKEAIEETKSSLAAELGVEVAAIEIVVRV